MNSLDWTPGGQTMRSVINFLFWLIPAVLGLELKMGLKEAENRLSPRRIGFILHLITNFHQLGRLLSTKSRLDPPLPFIHYYNTYSQNLTWSRINQIATFLNQEYALFGRSYACPLKALLNSECIAFWNGLDRVPLDELKDFLKSHPESNPLLAIGDLVMKNDYQYNLTVKNRFENNPELLTALLESASSATVTHGLLFEQSLANLLDKGVVKFDPWNWPRLLTPKVYEASNIRLQSHRALPDWKPIDRYIVAMTVVYANVSNFKSEVAPIYSSSKYFIYKDSRYSELIKSIATFKPQTPLCAFIKELLKNGGIAHHVLNEERMTPAQIEMLERLMENNIKGPIVPLLFRNVLVPFLSPYDFMFNNISSRLAKDTKIPSETLVPYFQGSQLKAALLKNVNPEDGIPYHIASQWTHNRYGNNNRFFIEHFLFEDRMRLMKQRLHCHRENIDDEVTLQFTIQIDGRQDNLHILEDVASGLDTVHVMNRREITAQSVTFGSGSGIQNMDVHALMIQFWTYLTADELNLFSRIPAESSANRWRYRPRPWIHPKLWFLIGRFLALCFKNNISLAGSGDPIDFTIFSSIFSYNNFNIPDLTKDWDIKSTSFDMFDYSWVDQELPETINQAITSIIANGPENNHISCHLAELIDLYYDPSVYSTLFDSYNAHNDSTSYTLFTEDDVHRLVKRGMLAFWLGMQPIPCFFTAEEVYIKLFGAESLYLD